MAMSIPMTVTIVSFGTSSPANDLWQHELKGDTWSHYDCRDYLPRDPSVHVHYNEDGTCENTQRAVYQQKYWPELMEKLLTDVWSRRCMSVCCNKGKHRSNVTARTMESLLNSATDHEGRRYFNCKHFALGQAGRSEAADIIQRAKDWAASPWVMMPRPAEVFGQQAALESPDAFRNFEQVKIIVDRWSMAPEEAAAVKRARVEPPASEEHAGKWSPTPPSVPPPAWMYDDDSGVHSSSAAAAAASSPRTEIPEWVTFSQDASKWYSFLRSHNVDENAVASLVLLASHSEQGWRSANSIIAKIAKKAGDGVALGNPSGFVHRCVQNARASIPGGWGV